MVIVDDDGATITGTGELDLGIGREFDAALAGAVASGRPVTVDLAGATFVDSAILQSLAIHGKTLRDRGERLAVIVTSGGYPEYVLKVVGFGCLMDITAHGGLLPDGVDMQ